MQTIRVIYSRSRKPGSYLIRAFDKGAYICPFSHVGIVSECGQYVYEALYPQGVVKAPLWEFKRRASHWEICRFPTRHRPRTVYRRAKSQLGKPYDLKGAIAIGIPFVGRDWGCQDSWFCSEFLAYCTGMFYHKHLSNIGVNYCYALSWPETT
jgi:hypothetical protein